ncbi:MAG: glycosyltransferase [Euzebya sp.]
MTTTVIPPDRRRIDPAPFPISTMLIVVPARNEQHSLPRTLASLAVARRAVDVHSRVVVVADACTDGTVAVARQHRRDRHDLVVQQVHGCVGAARAYGTEAGLARLTQPLSRVWLATTDADTVVPPDWLGVQLAFARQGVCAVAGIVSLLDRGTDAADPVLQQAFDRGYRTDPRGTHPHVHAANLGVRADAYLQAGGWHGLPTGEEHDLWRRLKALDPAVVGPMVSTTTLTVATSARRRGRAPSGFAANLRNLDRSVA